MNSKRMQEKELLARLVELFGDHEQVLSFEELSRRLDGGWDAGKLAGEVRDVTASLIGQAVRTVKVWDGGRGRRGVRRGDLESFLDGSARRMFRPAPVGRGIDGLQVTLNALPAGDPACRDARCGWWERSDGFYQEHRPEDHQ
jgi:hypothetical protein